MLKLIDLERSGKPRARSTRLTTVCDNTFMSSYFQKPLALGIDVVMHSTTKYLNGHSDVVGGFLGTRDLDLAQRLAFLQNAGGRRARARWTHSWCCAA